MLDALFFIPLGLLYLSFATIVDTGFFFAHLFSDKVESIKDNFELDVPTLDDFYIMHDTVALIEKNNRIAHGEDTVSVKSVIAVFRHKLEIEECLRKIIFDS